MAIWTLATTILFTLLLGIPIILMGIFSKTGRLPYLLGRSWAWVIIRANRVKLSVDGIENLVKNRSYIFISNHMSNLDPLAVAKAIPRTHTLRFVGKKSLSRIPVFGWAARIGRVIFIDRSNSQKAIESINRTIQELKNGISAFFFAEGTRSSNGKIKSFKKGGVALALKAKLPIIPITVINSHNLLPKNSLKVRKGIIKIIVGDPIDTSSYTESDRDILTEKVRAIIAANLLAFGEAD